MCDPSEVVQTTLSFLDCFAQTVRKKMVHCFCCCGVNFFSTPMRNMRATAAGYGGTTQRTEMGKAGGKTADCIGIRTTVAGVKMYCAAAEPIFLYYCSLLLRAQTFELVTRPKNTPPKRRNAVLLGEVKILQGLLAYWPGLRGKPKRLAGPGLEPALPGPNCDASPLD